MLTQRVANIVFAVIVLIACAWFAYIAEGFKATGLLATSGLPSKFFPQLMLACTALCSVIVIFLYALRGGSGGDTGKTVFANGGEALRGLLTLAVAIACYLIWKNFGFVPMAVLLGPLCLLAMGERNPLIYLTVWLLTGSVYLVFTRLLNIQLI